MEKQKEINERIKADLSAMTETLAEQQTLNAEDKHLLNDLLNVIYATAQVVFKIAPKLSVITLEAKDIVAEEPVKKSTNKRREFIVQQKGQKNCALWAVKGVKDDGAFSKLWSRQGEFSVKPLEDEHIGFLYLYLGTGNLHEVIYKEGQKLLVAAKDTRDVQNMLRQAFKQNLIPMTSEYNIRIFDATDTLCIYDTYGRMKQVSGGIHTNSTKGRVPFNCKYSVLQFDDFTDGKHKEF